MTLQCALDRVVAVLWLLLQDLGLPVVMLPWKVVVAACSVAGGGCLLVWLGGGGSPIDCWWWWPFVFSFCLNIASYREWSCVGAWPFCFTSFGVFPRGYSHLGLAGLFTPDKIEALAKWVNYSMDAALPVPKILKQTP